MEVILGIDIGISTCKIAGFKDNNLCVSVQNSTSGVEVINETLDLFLKTNDLCKDDIDKIMITGVGSTYLTDDICGIKPVPTSEFDANASFGLYCSQSDNFTVVSMGTGTSYIHVDGEKKIHLGGIALGGGSIKGLCAASIGVDDYNTIQKLSLAGNVENIDLRMADISKEEIPGLPPEITASDFAKATANESKEDIAAGIVHLVIENILQTGVLISKPLGVKELVLIGGLADYPQCLTISNLLKLMHKDIIFNIPDKPVYGSAIGAALNGMDRR